MPIEIAAHAGFCMGVRRAVESAVQVADSGVPSCTLGELIHNPTVVDMLRQRGIPPVASAEEAAGRQVLIRSHGVAPEVIRQLENAGCKVVDLTCPFVNKLHRVVAEDTSEDCPLIMVGEREHPEGHAAGRAARSTSWRRRRKRRSCPKWIRRQPPCRRPSPRSAGRRLSPSCAGVSSI